MAVMIASSPGQTFCVTYFTEHIAADLGLSQTRLSTVYMVATLLAALPLPYFGALADRIGLRRATGLVGVSFGVACVLMSQVAGIASLLLAFLALRALGPGALVLLSNNTLAAWFHRRLSTASGTNSFVMSLAMCGVPWTALALIDAYGWRIAYVVLGLIVWMLVLPLVALVFRNRPDDVGQALDGESLAQAEASVATPDLSMPTAEEPRRVSLNDQGLTLTQARRQRSFWILLLGTSTWTMVGTGIVFAIVPLFKEQGLTATHAATAFTLQTIAQALAQLGSGALLRAVAIRHALSATLCAMAASAAMLAVGWNAVMLPAFMAYGAAQGVMTVIAGTAWAEYFGRKHLGKIRGASMTAAVGGSSLGPVILGVSFDYAGGFTAGLWILAGAAAAIAVAAPLATPPREE